MTTFHSSAIALALLGGFNNGYNVVNLSETIGRLKWSRVVTTTMEEGILMSAAHFGMLIALAPAAYLADAIGRRRSVVVGESIVVAGCALQAIVGSAALLITARFVLGLGLGICLLLKPLFIAELAGRDHRGKLLVLFAIAFSIGINIPGIAGATIVPEAPEESVNPFSAADASTRAENEWVWRVQLALGALPALGLLIVAHACAPESPEWLRTVGRAAATDSDAEAAERLKPDEDADDGIVSGGICGRYEQLWTNARARYATKVGLVLGVLWVGNGQLLVMQYRNDIFKQVFDTENLSTGPARACIVGLGVAHLLGVAAALPLVDRIGRRPLLLIGISGAIGALCCAAAGLAYIPSAPLFVGISCIAAVFFAQLGPDAVLYTIPAEMYETRHRAIGMSLQYYVLGLTNLAVNMLFPVGAASPAWGYAGWFVFFAVVTTACGIYLEATVPETLGTVLARPSSPVRSSSSSKHRSAAALSDYGTEVEVGGTGRDLPSS